MPAKCPKLPGDPAQLAKLMIDIASGEVEDKKAASEQSTLMKSRHWDIVNVLEDWAQSSIA
jgi:hypothetical protein